MICLAFAHACCLTHSAKQNGLRKVSFLFRRGSGSPIVRSQRPCDYRTQLVHFGIVRFLAAIPTENERTKKLRRIGERSRRRGVGAFLRKHIGLAMLSAGSPLGLRAPDCAKESKVEAALPPLWTLFTLRRGCLSAYTRRHPGTRKDPPGSDLWPGGSGCIAMLPIRTIVQTRSAPKR